MLRPLLAAAAVLACLPGCSFLFEFDGALLTEVCTNGIDDDADGRVDCADETCTGAPECLENVTGWCNDRKDNDKDRLIDCNDPDCSGLADCAELSPEACSDGRDNDGDSRADCDDPGCAEFANCAETTAEACADGVDNNSNGDEDCADIGCQRHPFCHEDTPETCADGKDNDQDLVADCQDPNCAGYLPCTAEVPVVRDEPCQPGRQWASHDAVFPPVAPRDDDGEVFPREWQAFAPELDQRPRRTVSGLLFVNGLGEGGWAGVASQVRFGTGRNQPLEAVVNLVPIGPCGSAEEGRCRTRIELHTRDDWAENEQEGDSIFSLELDGTSGACDVRSGTCADTIAAVSCTYHGEPVPMHLDAVNYTIRGLLRVRMTTDDDGNMNARVGGKPVCSFPLRPLEPEGRLVLSATGPVDAQAEPSAFYVRNTKVTAQAERPPAECAGLRSSLFPDRFCANNSVYDGGVDQPRVVLLPSPEGVPPDALMLLRANHHGTHHHLLTAVSKQGVTRWSMGPDAIDAYAAPGPIFLGAMLVVPEEQRIVAWVTVGGVAQRIWAALAAPDRWYPDDALLWSDGAADRVPETVIRRGYGFQGWFTDRSSRVPRIVLAESRDGLRWETLDDAMTGDQLSWDSDGTSLPAAVWAPNGGHVVMAYASPRFGFPSAIGLAFSPDGRTWTRHTDNPVFVGEQPDLNLGGVAPGSLGWVDGRLWLWHTGTTVSETCEQGFVEDEKWRIAAAQLTPGSPR